MNKTLDEKLIRILDDSSVGDFILADAKDGEMGGGIPSPGIPPAPDADRHPYRTHQEYMQYMRDVTVQGLVGRKINNSEDQLSTVIVPRGIADGEPDAESAVREYHGRLEKKGIKPDRRLKDDLVLRQV